jgi:hypothetical protein
MTSLLGGDDDIGEMWMVRVRMRQGAFILCHIEVPPAALEY